MHFETFSGGARVLAVLSRGLLKHVTSERTVSHQTNVQRQPPFFFSSLLSAVTVDLPRSCLVRSGIALIGKPPMCNSPIMSFARSNARLIVTAFFTSRKKWFPCVNSRNILLRFTLFKRIHSVSSLFTKMLHIHFFLIYLQMKNFKNYQNETSFEKVSTGCIS